MQRSRTQVLFSYLPGSIFVHETGYTAKSIEIRGSDPPQLSSQKVLLEEIDRYLAHWDDNRIQGLRRPSRVASSDFRVLTPEGVRWEIWPRRFECARENCRRIVSFQRIDDIQQNPRCTTCNGRLRQLRYLSAHSCGRILQMHIPDCKTHGWKHVYFDDTGTFRTAVFRCRKCNGGIIRRTLQSPCSCNLGAQEGERPKMHAYTIRDNRIYFPHYLSLINLQSQTFNDLQSHARRGEIAIASYLGHLGPTNAIHKGLQEANQPNQSPRLSPDEWTEREHQLRDMGLSEEEIEAIRARLAPSAAGLASLPEIESTVIDVGERRRVVERAALFDTSEVSRRTLRNAQKSLSERGETAASQAVASAIDKAHDLGIASISVTWAFPIALAAFGYTRSTGRPGEGILQGFLSSPDQYQGKYPVFAVATDTEAVLITLSAARVMDWLAQQHAVDPTDEDPKLQILRLFASEASNPRPPELVHPRVSGVAVLGSGYDFAEGFRSVGCGSGGVGGAGCCVYYAAA